MRTAISVTANSLPRCQQVLGGALIVQRGKVLLLQRHATEAVLPGQWVLPSGKKELGEQLEEAVKREAAEETGCEVVVERLFNYYEYGSDARGMLRDCTQLNFLCRIIDPSAQVTVSSEHATYRWFGPADLAAIQNQNIRRTLEEIFRQTAPVKKLRWI
ncbi:MAG TPA: NUDIX hydrolase [bacterium]|nr:NUDIX hydrolase [bacterium]